MPIFLSVLLLMFGFGDVALAEQANVFDGAAEPADSLAVSVPFVTNRGREQDESPEDTFTGERGVPHVGRCEVQFTSIPVFGDLAPKMRFHIPYETTEIQRAEPVDVDSFWQDLLISAKGTSSGTVVVFVHGYNYGFARTCGMAANLQRALEGKASVLMLSWPSIGRPTDYLPDLANVEWSVPFIARVIGELVDRIDPSNVQILAHSLGTRGVVFALERLGSERATLPVVGRLVLAAPDFDAQTFVDRLPTLLSLVDHASLYVSSNDGALKASRQLHGASRLGEAGEFLTVQPGLETIDVSPAGRYQILGHEYFHFHPQVSADLVALLGEGVEAAERPGLVPKKHNGHQYWELAGSP